MKKLQIFAEVIVPNTLDMSDHYESIKAALAEEFGVIQADVAIPTVEEGDILE